MLGLHEPRGAVSALTGEECVRAARKLREGLNAFNVSLAGGTALEGMLRKLEGIGARHPGSFWEAPLLEQEKLDVRYIEQVTRFAGVLEGLRSPFVSGDLTKRLTWFRKPLDTLLSLKEEAQDHLVELEVGAAFAAAGLQAQFEEPDIVTRGKGLRSIAVPVKHPHSAKRVGDHVRDAVGQVRNRRLPGVVLPCLDAIVNSDSMGKPVQFWSRSLKGLNAGTFRRFEATVKRLEPTIRGRTDPAVIGIIWFARMPGSVVPPEGSVERSSYSRTECAIASLNGEHWEGRGGPLRRLLAALRRGTPSASASDS